MTAVLETLEECLAQLDYYIVALERKIPKPFEIIDNEKVRGFRYGKPGIVHYTVINLANSSATLKSTLILSRLGFNSQAAILMRFIMEANSKLSYVLSGLNGSELDRKSESFLNDYFSDNVRDGPARRPYKAIPQKDIHRRNSEKISRDLEHLRNFGINSTVKNDENQYAKLLSSLYSNFSNHVHGRYPEMMDIFGEFSRELKLSGNTESKDVDASIEFEFLHEIALSTTKNLKLALVLFEAASLISMTADEKNFALKGIL